MKQHQYVTPTHPRTTTSDVCRWAQTLWRLYARLAPRFARPEPYHRMLSYLQGILSETSRKNGWQLAEHAGEARPDGMQRLLSSAVWDTEGVRDDLRAYAFEHLGQESAIVAIDETSFPKRGNKSAGVGVQYCGTTGQVQNCQVGVFLSYVTAKGHTLIDRELYLPSNWCQDPLRCRSAGIPDSVRFQTKPELAIQMMKRLRHASIQIAWVVADTVYGGNLDLRIWLEAHHFSYVLAVACTELVGILTSQGERRYMQVREVEALRLQAHDWHRLTMGEGSKGPRLFDWACVPILHRWEQDGHHFLLVRRNLSNPDEQTSYVVFAPQGTTLSEMVQACGARWKIEEDFETGKDLGLDQYEVRTWIAWYRHITLVLLAQAFLTGICSDDRCVDMVEQESILHEESLLPLTRPEVSHLLGLLIWPSPRNVSMVFAWSWWRQRHRSRASYYHTRRRLKAG